MTTLKPILRFPEFKDTIDNSYKNHFFKDIFQFSTGKNIKQNEASPEFETPCVRYGELYYMYNEVIRKVINKTNLNKSELLLSDGDEILLPSAGEDPLDIGSSSALLIKNVAIGRTINVLKPIKENVYSQIYVSYYINQKLRIKISKLAKGSSISNVYNSDLKTLEIILPNLPEQTKIANFLTAVDEKIQALKEKKRLLEEYKKGLIQKIFSQEIRFKQDNGSDFPEWEEKSLGEILTEHKTRNLKNQVEEVFSVAKNRGVINQIEHLGRSYASEITTNYKIVYPDDIIYTKSPTSDFPFGIIKQNKLNRTGIVSVLYGVFTPKNKYLGLLLDYYFSIWQNTYNYLNPLVQKGAKNTMNIGNNDFLNGEELYLPSSTIEQQKIAKFLTSIDEKIEKVGQQIEEAQTFKKGLLQQMFV